MAACNDGGAGNGGGFGTDSWKEWTLLTFAAAKYLLCVPHYQDSQEAGPDGSMPSFNTERAKQEHPTLSPRIQFWPSSSTPSSLTKFTWVVNSAYCYFRLFVHIIQNWNDLCVKCIIAKNFFLVCCINSSFLRILNTYRFANRIYIVIVFITSY